MRQLGEVLSSWRWAKRLSISDAAAMLGVTRNTFNRLERGENCDGETLAKVLRWLMEPGTVAAEQEKAAE